uniref:(northern house mosquito) hypothetical protein n=1 Tax=Culex pipiens TaxID=7175 RepID=A0A8D8HAM5_CULPI
MILRTSRPRSHPAFRRSRSPPRTPRSHPPAPARNRNRRSSASPTSRSSMRWKPGQRGVGYISEVPRMLRFKESFFEFFAYFFFKRTLLKSVASSAERKMIENYSTIRTNTDLKKSTNRSCLRFFLSLEFETTKAAQFSVILTFALRQSTP